MNKLYLLNMLLLLNLLLTNLSQAQDAILFTKNGEGYVHDNIDASVHALALICDTLKLEAKISADPAVFNDKSLKNVKVIIFTNTNNDVFTTEEQKAAFVKYIRNGGGFVGIHSACGTERNWPWFQSMLGGKFVRHPVLQPFDIRVIDPAHPTVSFLPNPWKWEDECYYMDHLNPDIHVLLAVDMTTIDDPNKSDYPGVIFGDLFPLAWIHEFDGGREFYTALGHKIEHYTDPFFVKHLKTGINWAMGK